MAGTPIEDIPVIDRHNHFGFILPKEALIYYISRYKGNYYRIFLNRHKNAIPFIMADLFLDWRIAGYGMELYRAMAGPGVRNMITKWVPAARHKLNRSDSFRSLSVIGAIMRKDRHINHKRFTLFKLRCDIVFKEMKGGALYDNHSFT